MTNASNKSMSLQDVWKARKRIAPYIEETALQQSATINRTYQTSVHVKLENMHEIGAFKIRGATNKMLALSKEDRAKGVTTFSTGNHGLAVAYMAKILGIRAVICISNRVPNNKVQRLER